MKEFSFQEHSWLSFYTKITMGENIYLLGNLIGMSLKDINKKFNSIVEFSGLENFINTKLY